MPPAYSWSGRVLFSARASDINAIDCIMVSAATDEQYGNGYRLRLTLKSGEHVFLTRSYASRVLPVEAPESPPFKVARILKEKLAPEASQQDRG
jgi:hypothetical protein